MLKSIAALLTLSLVLAPCFALSAKETVFRHPKSPKNSECFVYLDYEAPFSTHPKDVYTWDDSFSCAEWDKLVQYRTKLKTQLQAELKAKGLLADFQALAEYRFNQNDPKKIVAALNRISKAYPSIYNLDLIFTKVVVSRLFGESFMLRNMMFSLSKIMVESDGDTALEIAGASSWEYIMKTGQCGRQIPLFIVTFDPTQGPVRYVGDNPFRRFGIYFSLDDESWVSEGKLKDGLGLECPEDLNAK